MLQRIVIHQLPACKDTVVLAHRITMVILDYLLEGLDGCRQMCSVERRSVVGRRGPSQSDSDLRPALQESATAVRSRQLARKEGEACFQFNSTTRLMTELNTPCIKKARQRDRVKAKQRRDLREEQTELGREKQGNIAVPGFSQKPTKQNTAYTVDTMNSRPDSSRARVT